MHRRLTSLAAALALGLAGLAGLTSAPAQAAPADYKIHSTDVIGITGNGTTIPISTTLTCPAGTVVQPTVRLSGVTVVYRNQWESGTWTNGGGLAREIPQVYCTGSKQTVTGFLMTNWTPLTYVGYLPTRNVTVTTTVGTAVTEKKINLGEPNPAIKRVDGYTVDSIKVGNISSDLRVTPSERRLIPLSFDYTCPAGQQAYILATGSGILWEFDMYPGQVISDLFLGGLGTVTCTGRKQTFEGGFQTTGRYVPYFGYFLPSRDVRIVIQLGPTTVEKLVNIN